MYTNVVIEYLFRGYDGHQHLFFFNFFKGQHCYKSRFLRPSTKKQFLEIFFKDFNGWISYCTFEGLSFF